MRLDHMLVRTVSPPSPLTACWTLSQALEAGSFGSAFSGPLACLQLSHLRGGGSVVGLSLSHTIADGCTAARLLARLSELYREEEERERQAVKDGMGGAMAGSGVERVEAEDWEWDRGQVARLQQQQVGRVEPEGGEGSEEEERRMQKRFDAITVAAPGSSPGAGLKATLKAQVAAGQALVQVGG